MTAFLVWTAYVISLFLLVSDILGLLAVWVTQAKAIWCYFYTRLWGRIVMATVAYLVVIIGAYWVTYAKLELIKILPFQITNWDDLRTFGLGLSGIVAAWLAIVGYILSATRTKVMEDANRQQVDDHRQRLYMDALDTLNRKKDYQKAGAIESLRKLGRQEDGEYRTQVIEILTAFIRSTARIANQKTKRRLNPEGTALNLASALYALSDLLNQPTSFTMTVGHQSLDFKNLDLSELIFTKSTNISHLNFFDCDFSKSQFIDQTISSVTFARCDLTGTSFEGTFFRQDPSIFRVIFAGSKIDGTVISNTDFEGTFGLLELDLLFTRYHFQKPPRSLPRYYYKGDESRSDDIVLPPPMSLLTGDYLNYEETRKFHWDTDDEFRPRHSDGSFVRIVDPNNPTKVILDREPSSEPGEPQY